MELGVHKENKEFVKEFFPQNEPNRYHMCGNEKFGIWCVETIRVEFDVSDVIENK